MTVDGYALYKGPTIRYGCWEFTASDAAAGALFGRSVAIDGDVIVIGAYGDASLGANTGAAYVYERSGGVWTETQKLVGTNAGDRFGWSVAVNQGTIVVGAPFEWIGGVQEVGATYVYTKVGGTWVLQQKLEGNQTADWPRYGSSIAIDGDWLITGSQQGNLIGLHKGGAHGWLRSAGIWTKHELPTDSSMISIDKRFGTSVALDVAAGWAIVSEPAATGTSGGGNAGEAHVFKLIGSDWVYHSSLLDGYSPDIYMGGGSDQLFTECVAIRGNYAFISRPRPSSLWKFNHIYVCKYNCNRLTGVWRWSLYLKIKSGITADNPTGDRHGSSICILDDRTLVVGAPYQVWWDGTARRITGLGVVYYTNNGWLDDFHESLIYEQPPETGVGLGWSVSADSSRQILMGKPFVNASAGSAVLFPEATAGVPAPIPDGYLMQATDSVTGVLYHWTSETRDMAAVGYPGPNEAVDVAVSSCIKGGGNHGPEA